MKNILMMTLAVAAFGQSADAPEGMKERTNLRNARYCEVLVVHGNLLSAKAGVYNTIGLNDCPEDKWAALDPNKLKKEFKALQVVLNGPRYFVMDRNALKNTGPGERKMDTFGGIPMRLLAYVEVHPMQKRTPYTENAVERQTQYVYERGKDVYELVAPDGRTYVMQSYSQEIDKNLHEGDLANLGSKLKLPKGWHYRVRRVDRDLIVRNAGTKAYVLQDDLRDSYQRMQ